MTSYYKKRYQSRISKYRNIKVVHEGVFFDSMREMKRYAELRILERAGKITDFRLQVRFVLKDECKCCGQVHEIFNAQRGYLTYIADFVYERDGKIVIEDAKGYRTTEYKRKKKIMAKMGYKIIEV